MPSSGNNQVMMCCCSTSIHHRSRMIRIHGGWFFDALDSLFAFIVLHKPAVNLAIWLACAIRAWYTFLPVYIYLYIYKDVCACLSSITCKQQRHRGGGIKSLTIGSFNFPLTKRNAAHKSFNPFHPANCKMIFLWLFESLKLCFQLLILENEF